MWCSCGEPKKAFLILRIQEAMLDLEKWTSIWILDPDLLCRWRYFIMAGSTSLNLWNFFQWRVQYHFLVDCIGMELYSEIFENEDNLEIHTHIFDIFFPEIFRSTRFWCPNFREFRLNGNARIPEIQQSFFRKFWSNGRRP